MTDTGTHVVVDAGEKGLDDLLQIVRTQGRTVRICVSGQAVAELSPAGPALKTYPELSGVVCSADAFSPLSEAEWPVKAR